MNPEYPSDLGAHAWWDAMARIRQRLRPEAFERWATRKVRPWKVRLAVIGEMAWNDRDSDWNLEYESVMAKHRFLDGEPVTAELVASSLNNMLEGVAEEGRKDWTPK